MFFLWIKDKIKDLDIFIIVGMLCVIGLLALHSSSYTPQGLEGKDFAKSQFIWILISILFVFFIVKYGYVKLLDKAYIFYFISILLLLLIFITGNTRLGARRWLNLGFFLIQPAELCKVAFILALVRYISDNVYKLNTFYGFFIPFLGTLLPALLIMMQPDLGTALTLFPILFIVLFASGIKKRFLFMPIISAFAASPFLWNMLKPYQKSRVFVFLNPNIDPLGAGYTVIQSKIAIGSGGLIGKGWMSGTQNQLNFLPERHTDFIFSVIGEEWGFLGTISVVFLFLLLFIRLLRIADYSNDLSGKLLVLGIVTLLWFQAVVNIAMVMGLMPTVGLPLPFITYGGSNLLAAMLLMGMAKSVEVKAKSF